MGRRAGAVWRRTRSGGVLGHHAIVPAPMGGTNSTARNRITNPGSRRERGGAASGFPSLGAARRQFGVERLRSVGKNTPALLLPALRMRPNVVTSVAPEVQEPLQNCSQAGLLARTGGACETTHEGMNVRGLCSAVHRGAPDRSAWYRGGNRSAHSAKVNRTTTRLDCDTRIRPAASHHQHGPVRAAVLRRSGVSHVCPQSWHRRKTSAIP